MSSLHTDRPPGAGPGLPGLHRAVTDWFDDAARDLPWRDPSCSPWGVLVSEFMLQQTPVVRVLPVWRAWMQRWPRPADLAAESTFWAGVLDGTVEAVPALREALGLD